MTYRIFAANPAKYNLEEALRTRAEARWRLGHGDAHAGDRVAIWQYLGHDADRGVVGFARVLTQPEISASTDPLWRPGSEDLQAPAKRARIRYQAAPRLPLWVSTHPWLLELPPAKAQGGTVFHLTPEQWARLVQEAGEPQDVAHFPDEILDTSIESVEEQGQRLASLAKRRAIESHAIAVATEHLDGLGWKVQDVQATGLLDLFCRRDGETMAVEVKGSQQPFGSMLVTAGEVRYAQERPAHCAMVTVSNIIVLEQSDGSVGATGGVPRAIRPWNPEFPDLDPTAYRWRPPRGLPSADL